MIMFTPGQIVRVQHGASHWLGTVRSTSPGHIIVGYPRGSEPGDQMPARELIDLTKHQVVKVDT